MSVATARQGEVFIAVGAAVALHGVVFGLLVLLALAEILIDSKREKTEPSPPPAESLVVELSSDYFATATPLAPVVAPAPVPVVPVEPEPVAVAVPKDRLFMDTNDAQASETPPEAAAFIGERDTRAATELAPDPDGPALPTQAGEEARRNELELFDSKFNEGDDPGDPAVNPAEPEKLAGHPVDGVEGEGTPSEPERMEVKESLEPSEVLLDSQDAIPVPVDHGERAEVAEATLPREKQNEKEAETARKGEEGAATEKSEAQPRKSGFRTEAKKTNIRGSLNRRGESALDVDNTVVGRYRAKVYRAIENEWQLQCLNYRDHILPGSLALRFYVDHDRNILNPRYTYEFEASEIQRGFTLNSVRLAKIPPMPKEVRDELDGEPMECEIGFNF